MKYFKSNSFKMLMYLGLSIAFINISSCIDKANMKFIDVRKLNNVQESVVVEDQGYFPVIVGLPTDEVLVVLRGGAPHLGIGGRLDIVRSSDAGVTWSKPYTVIDSEKDDRNPSLGLAADGTLALAFHWQASYDEEGKWKPDPYKQDTKIILSDDICKTWEKPTFLNVEIQRGNSPFGKMFKDAEGTLFMPIYGAKNPKPGIRIPFDTTYTFLISSKDNGQTWGDIIEVAKGYNEADFLILPNGEWLCATRSQKSGEQAIFLCRSSDNGRTWSDPIRITERREHPPDFILLNDGTVLLIFGVRHEPFSIQGMVSRDFGRTWLKTRLLFADKLPGKDIGYPSTVRLTNGKLITVYYRAGKKGQSNKLEIACVAICYDEKILLKALKSVE